MSFDVRGQHVTVVGAARSGLAAVDLLQQRGAQVTLADQAPHIDVANGLRARGVRVELGPHAADQFLAADLVVLAAHGAGRNPAVYGSVTEQILHHGRRPLLVVRDLASTLDSTRGTEAQPSAAPGRE